MIPYTYILKWTKLKIYYFGVRYSSKCEPDDLFKTYFTSSKHVKYFIRINGIPDIIKVTKIFQSAHAALEWEKKFLARVNAINNPHFLNRSVAGHFSTKTSIPNKIKGQTYQDAYGTEKTQHIKEKQAYKKKLYWESEEGMLRRKELSISMKGNKYNNSKDYSIKNKIEKQIPWNKGVRGLTTAWNKGVKNTNQSIRMSTNNPMKNPKSVEKLKATRRVRISEFKTHLANMTEVEFARWVDLKGYFLPSGRRNPIVSRGIKWRDQIKQAPPWHD